LIVLKSSREIARMHEAGRLVARALDLVEQMARPGTSSLQIDAAVENLFRSAGGELLFKGYGAAPGRPAFPATICASFNDEVVHGIPDDRKLRPGDLLSVDVGVRLKNYVGDAAVTVGIQPLSGEARKLMATCREALEIAIDRIRPGVKWAQVARAIQRHVEAAGFSVVEAFTGHGIGQQMHEEPQLPNYVGTAADEIVLQEGMTFAVEPMINAGGRKVKTRSNGWTAVTADGSLSAHFEHSVAVTADGALVLTAR